MKRFLPLAIIAALVLGGCTAKSPAPPAEQPPQSEPFFKPVPPPPVQPQHPTESIQIPPVPGSSSSVVPAALEVRPDGKAFALWYIIQADGLMVWQEGDQQAVKLSGFARREVAWAPEGLYFVHVTAVLDGQPQIKYYQWGAKEPVVVVDSDKLTAGYPRSLKWDVNGRLLYSDDEGIKAFDPQTLTISGLNGPPVPVTIEQSAFLPGPTTWYVTAAENRLLLANTTSEPGFPLVDDLGGRLLYRVVFQPTGSKIGYVAVEVGQPKSERQTFVFEVPSSSPARKVLEVYGHSPVILGEKLLYLSPEQQVMRHTLTSGGIRAFELPPVHNLAGDQATGRLYLIDRNNASGTIPFIKP